MLPLLLGTRQRDTTAGTPGRRHVEARDSERTPNSRGPGCHAGLCVSFQPKGEVTSSGQCLSGRTRGTGLKGCRTQGHREAGFLTPTRGDPGLRRRKRQAEIRGPPCALEQGGRRRKSEGPEISLRFGGPECGLHVQQRQVRHL